MPQMIIKEKKLREKSVIASTHRDASQNMFKIEGAIS